MKFTTKTINIFQPFVKTVFIYLFILFIYLSIYVSTLPWESENFIFAANLEENASKMYWQQKAFLRKKHVSIRFQGAKYESAVCQAEEVIICSQITKTKWRQ